MKEDEQKCCDTRERLIQAGGEVFSRCGFAGATVREICQLAQANVAAINYHFGDKSRLYSAVLEYTLRSLMEKYPPGLGVSGDSTTVEKLQAFIRSFLLRILDEGRPAWYGKLIAREISEPTSALDELIGKVVTPLYERLTAIVKDLMGEEADELRIRLCAFSIMGQCLFYRHSRFLVSRLDPQQFDGQEIERLSEHITAFSLAGIRALAK